MDNLNQQQGYHYDDEITLKELILKIKEFWRELWKYWWQIALIALPFVGYFAYKAITHIPTYEAKLTFMVNEEEGGGALGNLGGLASTFGINLGGSGGSINMMKVMALSKSKKITQGGVFEKVILDGKEDYIANHIIDVFDMHKDWEDGFKEGNIDLRGFKFANADVSNFSVLENAALNAINYQLHGGPEDSPDDQIFSGGQDEDTGIMNFKAVTPEEPLSIAISSALYNQLSTFYVEKAIEPQQATMETVTSKCDSLLSAFNKATYAAAAFEESNRNVFSASSKSRQARLQADIQITGTAYAKCLENKELADFSLRSARPVFQIIDEPASPIKPSQESLIKNLVIGGFLGGFLGAMFIISRKIYRDAMSTE